MTHKLRHLVSLSLNKHVSCHSEYTDICLQCCIILHFDDLYKDAKFDFILSITLVSSKVQAVQSVLQEEKRFLNAVTAGHQQRLIKVMDDFMSCGAHCDTVLSILR